MRNHDLSEIFRNRHATVAGGSARDPGQVTLNSQGAPVFSTALGIFFTIIGILASRESIDAGSTLLPSPNDGPAA